MRILFEPEERFLAGTEYSIIFESFLSSGRSSVSLVGIRSSGLKLYVGSVEELKLITGTILSNISAPISV